MPWTFFAHGLAQSSNSLVGSANLITKVYSSLSHPIATVLSGAGFRACFIVLLGMMLYYGIVPTINTLWLPLFLLVAVGLRWEWGMALRIKRSIS